MKRRILNIILGLYLALTFINVSIQANYALRVFYATDIDESSDPGWKVEHRRDRARLNEINSDGPAANVLRPGDEIVSINGQAQNSWLEAVSVFNNIPAGS